MNNNRSEENRDPSKDSVVIEKVIDAFTVINELWFQRSNLVSAAIFGWSIVNVEQAKEFLVIEKDPVFVPVESWLANPQVHNHMMILFILISNPLVLIFGFLNV